MATHQGGEHRSLQPSLSRAGIFRKCFLPGSVGCVISMPIMATKIKHPRPHKTLPRGANHQTWQGCDPSLTIGCLLTSHFSRASQSGVSSILARKLPRNRFPTSHRRPFFYAYDFGAQLDREHNLTTRAGEAFEGAMDEVAKAASTKDDSDSAGSTK